MTKYTLIITIDGLYRHDLDVIAGPRATTSGLIDIAKTEMEKLGITEFTCSNIIRLLDETEPYHTNVTRKETEMKNFASVPAGYTEIVATFAPKLDPRLTFKQRFYSETQMTGYIKDNPSLFLVDFVVEEAYKLAEV